MQALLPKDRQVSAANTLLKMWSDQMNYPTDQDLALFCQGLIIKVCFWLPKGVLYQMLQKSIFQLDAIYSLYSQDAETFEPSPKIKFSCPNEKDSGPHASSNQSPLVRTHFFHLWRDFENGLKKLHRPQLIIACIWHLHYHTLPMEIISQIEGLSWSH